MAKLPPLPFFTLRGHEGNISSLYFNNEKDDVINIQPTLLSGSETGEIFIWNLQTFRALFKFTSPEKKSILFLKYYRSKLYSQSKNGVINVWSYGKSKWTILRKYQSDTYGFCASVFWLFDDKAFLTLLNKNHMLDIYEVNKETKTKELKMNSSRGFCACLKIISLKDKHFFLAGFENGTIELRDVEEDIEIHSIELHEDPIFCLDFDSEFKMRGISGGGDGFLKIWSISDSYRIENVLKLTLTKPGVSDVKIRQDGKIVIVAGHDFNIRIFSWKTLKPLAILNFHEESVQCLACSPFPVNKKNSVFASGSKDKNIALWTIY